jgi:hypothetical protein
MLPRISSYVLAVVVAAGVGRADLAYAQQMELPLQLTSLEWLVADGDVVVRGVVVDVASYSEWNIVTLDVLESLKGAKAQRLKFAVYKLEKGNAALAQATKSKRELLWILKRQDPAVLGVAPDREKLMARHKVDLYAPFLPGRPGKPALPVIPLDSQEGDEAEQRLAFLTIDLQLLKTTEEFNKAIRAAIAEPQGKEPIRSYSVELPAEIARRTGFSRGHNLLTVPLDRRLEEFARRLVQTPADFGKHGEDFLEVNHLLRLEGVKALRLFPSEKNLAIVRAWLDDPMSTAALKDDRKTLVPAAPKGQQTEVKAALPVDLAQVPEVHFQQPLTKRMKTEDAQLHTAVTIDGVHLMNQKKTDAFIEALMSKRPDLAGLSFAMGDACRMKPEASKNFVAALDVFRKVEAIPNFPNTPFSNKNGENEKQAEVKGLADRYKDQATEKKIDPSASVATLMQVLAPEDGKTRLGLVKYLDGLAHPDATRALAKLAIFSAEAEVRTAAVASLKKRDGKDYTDILVAGLKYPWPAVAERSSEAMVTLGRKDLLPHLIDVLEKPDPRAPQPQEMNGKKVSVVRELVRVNHHHNCLLCHAPASATPSKEEAAKLKGLTAQVPVPSEAMVAYYRPSVPDILMRFDVTYLRQDFSTKLKVADADPWPEMQRYDFLVRTREVTDQEALAYQRLLQQGRPEAVSPYRRAALSALRELTGQDTEPTATAWRKLTGL